MLSSVRLIHKADRAILSSLRLCKVCLRSVATIRQPEYPSERDEDLVNDEFHEIYDDGTIEELEEAMEESSPFHYEAMDWLPKQIQQDPSIADKLQDYYKRCVKNLPPTTRMEYLFNKKMNLQEIWDTDLMPLAPVRRPKDIPADHDVDVWSFRDWRNVALTGSTDHPSNVSLNPSQRDINNYVSEDSEFDPRIVSPIDTRVSTLTQKILQPLLLKEDASSDPDAKKKDPYDKLCTVVDMNTATDYDGETEQFKCVFTKNSESIDAEAAKRIVRKSLRNLKEHQKKSANCQQDQLRSPSPELSSPLSREYVEGGETRRQQEKVDDFDVDGFRQLVQEYREEDNEEESASATDPFDTGFTLKVRYVDKVKASMTRRLSSALVCSGTESGGVAVGYARSEKSPDAVAKADAMSYYNRLFIELYEDRTLFAPVYGKFNQTRVKILPARRGHGIKGSDLMYGILNSLGVQDAICKVYGNTNPFSVTQAVMDALSKCTSLEEQALSTGRRYFDLDTIYKRHKSMND